MLKVVFEDSKDTIHINTILESHCIWFVRNNRLWILKRVSKWFLFMDICKNETMSTENLYVSNDFRQTIELASLENSLYLSTDIKDLLESALKFIK